MANEKNLIPFKKGPDPRRNSKGAPKKLPKLGELMAMVLGEDVNGITAAELILKKQRQKSMAGDQRATEFLFNRGYGQATQTVENLVNGEPIHGFIIKTVKDPGAKKKKVSQTI